MFSFFVTGRAQSHEPWRDASRERQVFAGGGGLPGGVAPQTGRRHHPDQPAEAVRSHDEATARVVLAPQEKKTQLQETFSGKRNKSLLL